MYYILLALLDEVCGVDIMARVEEISGGRVKVGPGTLYAMLQKFEENGLIERTAEEGRKKWYRITPRGQKMLMEEMERLRRQIADGERFMDLQERRS